MSDCTKCKKYEEIIAQKDESRNKLISDMKLVMDFDDDLRKKYVECSQERYLLKDTLQAINHIEARGGKIIKKPQDPIFKQAYPSCGDEDQRIVYCVHNEEEKTVKLVSQRDPMGFILDVPYCCYCGFSFERTKG